MKVKLAILGLFLSTTYAFAFIPPVPAVLREVFDARKNAQGADVVIRHQVLTSSGPIEIEERLVGTRTKAFIGLRIGGHAVSGFWEKGAYVFSGGKRLPSRSSILNRFLLSTSADDFRDSLIAERFLRRDQLAQYKPDFEPKGDPATWDLKENYVVHSDIFLTRLPGGVGIAVVGLDEGSNRRAVYFDTGLKGVRRLEWKDGGEAVTWTLDQFAGEPTFPKKMLMERGKEDLVSSEVVSCRWLKAKPLNEAIQSLKAKYPETSLSKDDAVAQLLSYR